MPETNRKWVTHTRDQNNVFLINKPSFQISDNEPQKCFQQHAQTPQQSGNVPQIWKNVCIDTPMTTAVFLQSGTLPASTRTRTAYKKRTKKKSLDLLHKDFHFSLDRSPDPCVTKKQPFIRSSNVRTHTRRKEECTSQITPPPLSPIRRLPRRVSGLVTLVEPTWSLAGLACSSFLPGSEEPGHKAS